MVNLEVKVCARPQIRQVPFQTETFSHSCTLQLASDGVGIICVGVTGLRLALSTGMNLTMQLSLTGVCIRHWSPS